MSLRTASTGQPYVVADCGKPERVVVMCVFVAADKHTIWKQAFRMISHIWFFFRYGKKIQVNKNTHDIHDCFCRDSANYSPHRAKRRAAWKEALSECIYVAGGFVQIRNVSAWTGEMEASCISVCEIWDTSKFFFFVWTIWILYVLFPWTYFGCFGAVESVLQDAFLRKAFTWLAVTGSIKRRV